MRQLTLRIHDELVVDNFAGGGGASLGIEWAIGRSPDLAINHDPEAIAMHAENHPGTRHVCGDVWDVNPEGICRGKRVALAWFSPDCKHFSKAKGGKPVEKKVRGLAWVVIRWARTVKPRVIILENVEEFADWGPLLKDGRPDPVKRGFTFRRWLGELQAAGYRTDVRQLRASDYGAPTSRKRLFIIARSDGQPIVWPEATHGPTLDQPHRTAAECITWEHPCPSIFERDRPLADNTLRRIARGIQRFVLESADPFLIPVAHGGHPKDGRPGADARSHSLRDPMRTVTGAHRGELALVAPTLCPTGYGERVGQAPRILDIRKPLTTIIAGGTGGNGKHALVSAFLAKHYGDPDRRSGGGVVLGSDLRQTLGTVTSRDHHGIVATSMVKLMGTCRDGQSWARPFPTIRAQGTHLGEVRAFLVKYYGTATGASIADPAPTVTTKDRMGLVTVAGQDYAIADIGMRMLAPRELFRAQGFHEAFVIDVSLGGKTLSKTAQVRMCGNSVCPPIAEAIVRANVGLAKAAVA